MSALAAARMALRAIAQFTTDANARQVANDALSILEEAPIENPEEQRRRLAREKKAHQRAAKRGQEQGHVPPVSPDVSPDCPAPVPEVSRDMSPDRTSLSSDLKISSSPEILSLSGDLKPARARAKRGEPGTAMPDPEKDPATFDAFVGRWSLPLSRDNEGTLSRDMSPSARKFVAHALSNGVVHKRWDWAWRNWQEREPEFNGAGSGVHRVQPAPAGGSRYKIGDGQ